MNRLNASLLIQRTVAVLLAFCILFATVARVPGAMLSTHEGTLTYEICTGDGVQIVAAPAENTPTEDTAGCEFFSAQIAALLGAAPDMFGFDAVYARMAQPVSVGLFADRGAAALYLIRGPPSLS